MSINPFNRDTAYFQIMRDRGMMINAEDLDFQFNNLTDYLNKKIVPLVNGLISREILGVDDPNLVGACLLNVGDGTTQWSKVNTNVITDYSIPLSKFINYNYDFLGGNIGSILATDNSKVFMPITPLESNNILLSRLNNSPIWRKIETGDVQNKSITAIKIGLQSVGLEHLSPELIGTNLAPNSILNSFIVNNTITGTKLLDGAITRQKLAGDLASLRSTAVSQNNFTLLDQSIENRQIYGGMVTGGFGTKIYQGNSMASMQLRTTDKQSYNIDDDTNYTFTSDNIIDNSLTANILRQISDPQYNTWYGVSDINQQTTFYRAVETKHIKDNTVTFYQVKNAIRKEKLAANIREKLGI